MKQFDIERVYEAYTKLDKAKCKELIARLNAEGITVSKIEAYIYKDAPGIKHLFFYLEGNKEAVPYFMMDKEALNVVQEQILIYE
mgnify:CR=1 FL=1